MNHWLRTQEPEPDGNGHRPLALLDRAVAPLRRPPLHRPGWRWDQSREPVEIPGSAPVETEPQPCERDPIESQTRHEPLREVDAGTELAVVRSVSVSSVARVACCFAFIGFVALIAAVCFLWILAAGSGELARFEDLLHAIGFTGVRIELGAVIAATALVGLALVVLVLFVAVLTAVVYNGVGRSVGGIRVEIVHPFGRPSTRAALSRAPVEPGLSEPELSQPEPAEAEPMPPEWVTPTQRAG